MVVELFWVVRGWGVFFGVRVFLVDFFGLGRGGFK